MEDVVDLPVTDINDAAESAEEEIREEIEASLGEGVEDIDEE